MTKLLTIISKAVIWICIAAAVSSVRTYAAEGGPAVGRGTLGAGLNYPGLGIRYFLSDHCALEAKGQLDGHIAVYGLRVYNYFWSADNMLLFLGAEADYIRFKGNASRGSGAAGELFGGFEYFAAPSISLQADFGPAYIYIKDRNNPISVSGVDYVANFGFNFYWGGGKAGGAKRAVRTPATRKIQAGQNSGSKKQWPGY